MAFIAAGSTLSATTQTSGNWTPAVNTGAISSAGRYTRVGNMIVCTGQGNWTSQAADSNNAFTMSGLPVTANSNGTNAGSGYGHFHYGGQGNLTLKVIPNTTTFQFYTGGPNLSTTTTYSSDQIGTVANIHYDNGGYLISRQNLRNGSSSTAHYFAVFLVYMV